MGARSSDAPASSAARGDDHERDRGQPRALAKTLLLGRVERGAPADLLVFREDPTRDLDALSTLEAVVADGRLYTREHLDEELARRRRYFEGALFDAVSVTLTRRLLNRVFTDESD